MMQRNSLRLIVACLFILTMWVSEGSAQFVSEEGLSDQKKTRLPIDYAAFASDNPDMIRLELYYQIYNPVLKFQKVGGVFEADYEMSVVVLDNNENRVAAVKHKKTATAASGQQTRSWSDFRVRQVNFDLPPGKYRVEFTLSDEDTEAILSRELKLKLKDYINRWPTLSDIELVQATEPRQKSAIGTDGTEGAESFAKGDYAVIPSVTGGFGGDQGSPLIYYLEIYRGTSLSESVGIETVLRSKTKGMVYRDTTTVLLTTPTVQQIRQITLTDFLAGDYDLEVVLKGRRNKKLDAVQKDLRINWSTEALLKYNYETAVDQLSYIASGSETDKLKKIKTFEERLKAFNEFWLQRDPTPGTLQNELKLEFYRRVGIANDRFTVMRREGWRTDRGRIYIQYGEPDQIDDYPVAADRRPYQEWHYYRHGAYLKFTFVDEFEDGDYRLQYPYDGLNQRP
jgi:GWxTD domain-containing protein